MFGKPLKKTASGEDMRERSTSIGASLRKQKSKKIDQIAVMQAKLQNLFLKLPKDLDPDEMRTNIEEGERVGVDREFLDRCRGNLAEADKIAAKKKEKARLAALEGQCNKVTAQLREAVPRGRGDLLGVDLAALRAMLDEATELEEAPNSPHKVEADLAASAHALLSEAEEAHAKRRKAALAGLKKASSSLLLVDSDALRKACTDAEVAGVDKAELKEAEAEIEAEKKDSE